MSAVESLGGSSVGAAGARFSSSHEVRKAVYSEWLAEKEARTKRERAARIQAKKEEELIKQQKKDEIAERTVKAVEKWSASKEPRLREELKLKKKEEEEAARAKAAEQDLRRRDAEVTFQRWAEWKTEQLACRHKKQSKKTVAEERVKQEEAQDKEKSALQAFRVWKERKDAACKERLKTKQKEAKKTKDETVEQKRERHFQSASAFDSWKAKKDEKIRTQKTLYTYRQPGSGSTIHSRGWCPARSMKYDYPREKAVATAARPPSSSALKATSSCYSDSSFEPDSEEPSLSLEGTDSAASDTPTGVHKTIQVCCQTLEYWCTCEDDNH